MTGQFECNVDLVLLIDGTGSMLPTIEEVKNSAKSFYSKLTGALSERDREVATFRIKVIVFRDYYCDGDKSMIESEFFTLPEQTSEFSSFISSIHAGGGGDEPENALEALAIGMKSNWTTEGTKKRHILMVWTDASAHKLEKASEMAIADNYPQGIPSTLTELSDEWNDSQSGPMNVAAKRLILFAPDAYPWATIGSEWENTVWVPSRAGEGMEETDLKIVLDVLAGSI